MENENESRGANAGKAIQMRAAQTVQAKREQEGEKENVSYSKGNTAGK